MNEDDFDGTCVQSILVSICSISFAEEFYISVQSFESDCNAVLRQSDFPVPHAESRLSRKTTPDFIRP